MNKLLLFLTITHFSFFAAGAKNKDHWYKVESTKEEKKQKRKSSYLYDSVEKSAPNIHFKEMSFWSLRPKLSFSGGFHADKAVFNSGNRNRWFFNTTLQFRNRPWNRVTANVLLLQNNSMFIGGSWEYTPSRKNTRDYYGIGVAHLLISEKEFSNLIAPESLYLTGHYGMEFLLESQHGISFELKGYLSGNNYALQLSVGYIIPL